MKRLILRLTVAILAFGFGLAVDRVFISRQPEEAPPEAQELPVPVATPAEVRTVHIVTTTAPPKPYAVRDFDPQNFDPAGVYKIIGKAPKDLEAFRYLELWWQEEPEGKLSGGARVQTLTDGRYSSETAVFSLVTRRRVVVVTQSPVEDAVGYRFEGEFLQMNLAAFANKQKPVLRGTLTKTKNGRKVTDRVVSLRLEQHIGC